MHAKAAAFAALLALSPAVFAQTVSTGSVETRFEELERKQRELERKLQDQAEAAEARGKGSPKITADPFSPDGFALTSDGEFRLRIGGAVQADDRAFLTKAPTATSDAFLIRRARLYLEGFVQRHIEFRVLPDFANGQPLLEEAFVDLNYTPVFRVQAGKFKEPLGLERLQSEVNTVFIERGLPSFIAPNRDTGVQAHGDLLGGALSYQAAFVNGAADGAVVENETDNNKDGVARVFVRPWKASGSEVWSDLGVGVAGSYGRQTNGQPLSAYATEAQQTAVSWLGATVADGRRRRLAPQAAWYPRNFAVLGEFVLSEHQARNGGATQRLTDRSYQVYGTWVVTGEKTSYNGLKPRRPFMKDGGLGAWELGARYSALQVDAAAFPRFANPAASARRLDACTGAVNWYLNASTRVAVNFVRTVLAGGPRGLEQAVLSRLQVSF